MCFGRRSGLTVYKARSPAAVGERGGVVGVAIGMLADMPQRTQRLHDQLGTLLDDLREVDDAETVRSDVPELEALQAELARILEEPAPPSSALVDRLRAALERFETRHPKLTLLTGRLADSLSDLGV